MPSFLPLSWRTVFGGLIGVLIDWVIMSAIISALLVFTDWLVYNISLALSGSGVVTFSFSELGTAHLKALPQFKYLDYYQYLWVGLVVIIAIASLLYSVSLAQMTEDETLIRDFYEDVASKAVVFMGRVLIIWVVGFLIYGVFFDPTYGAMHSNSALANLYETGRQGLVSLAGSDISERLLWVFEVPYPYIPAPFFVLIYVYILRNAHTGWLGNVWAQVAR